MNSSSSSLFHFTDSAEKLFNILRHEFKPKYCLERIIFSEDIVEEVAFPMVCFCDIPLSQVKNHIETYGYYGIGMSKEWAERNKLNPILYLKKNSFVSQNLTLIRDKLRGLTLITKADLDSGAAEDKFSTGIAFIDVLRYTKNYEGDLTRSNKLHKNVRFYNEREWRYVPLLLKPELLKSILQGKPHDLFLTKERYENPTEREKANLLIESQKLSFEPSDIRYIVVKNEKEIISMIEALKVIKAKYGAETIELLTSRILTSEQILNDF